MLCRRITSKKGKDSSVPNRGEQPLGTSESGNFGAVPPHLKTSTNYLSLSTERMSGIEQKIISSIKTFRKQN
jgi:hypothetical protein